ncbi:hypothetical protein B0H10DRAFT_1969187 [Mycena sp. CBHHK59/15]|nr:hypothetical protein B0H10DRAFT_1969187 [Mycena sp. CBHHK59/15]
MSLPIPRNVVFKAYSALLALLRLAGDSSALTCPKCAKKFNKGSSQKTVHDHMLSKACKGVSHYNSKSAIAPSVLPAPSCLARCTGIPLAWDAATICETYPFQIHSSSAKQPAKYDLILPETPNSPRARSKQCGGTFASPDGACAKCSDLVLDISLVRERASRTFEHVASEHLCLEHLSSLETVKVGADTKTVEAAATATSDWKDCMRTMEIVVEAWKRSVHRERLHGPILSIASDSDAKCCKALFMMTMHTEIIEGNPLYPYICNLPGLNRRVGKDNLTMDPDYKHKFKGTRSLLTSNVGLVVKGTCINCDLLFSWLERLTDHDWSETSLHALLDPADGQDVSTTIKLFLAIIELTSLDARPSSLKPSVSLPSSSMPGSNTDLTLSEQIESPSGKASNGKKVELHRTSR